MRSFKGFIVASFLCLPAVAQAEVKPRVLGWVENIRIEEVDLNLKAKLDTGATTSSIDAEVLDIKKTGERKKGDTGETIVFSMTDDDGVKKRVFERKVVRYVRIKKKGGAGYIRRPVVEMTFCLGGRLTKEEVNLANRENFIYPVLVGRNMLQHAEILVDASRTFVSRPVCGKK